MFIIACPKKNTKDEKRDNDDYAPNESSLETSTSYEGISNYTTAQRYRCENSQSKGQQKTSVKPKTNQCGRNRK